jgi:hydroxymethylbilane synthase
VGTRGSGLALRQTEEVLKVVRASHPDKQFQVVTLKTSADVAPEVPLAKLGRGMFVKEIERALLDGEIDMAVHSLKDMPTYLPEGLTLGAVCERIDPRDVLVNRWDCTLDKLPKGARIGTSSPRRVAQLRSLRPDLEVLPIRGNVDTRLRKARGPDYDGAVLAAAGVIRIERTSEVAEYLSPEEFVPAPGQGALAVEIREGDEDAMSLLSQADHAASRQAATAERGFLGVLGGGCQLPAGAYASVDGDVLVLRVFLSSSDGSQVFKASASGSPADPLQVAQRCHQALVDAGAGALMDSGESRIGSE